MKKVKSKGIIMTQAAWLQIILTRCLASKDCDGSISHVKLFQFGSSHHTPSDERSVVGDRLKYDVMAFSQRAKNVCIIGRSDKC